MSSCSKTFRHGTWLTVALLVFVSTQQRLTFSSSTNRVEALAHVASLHFHPSGDDFNICTDGYC